MVKPISDYVFFVADKEKETEKQTSFGTLHLAEFAEHGKFNRIYGTVIAVPGKLRDNTILHEIHQGFPLPQFSFSGENIESLIENEPHWKKEEKGRIYQNRMYSSSARKPEHVTLKDIQQEVEVGDKIYFHYNTIDEENRYKLEDGRKVYKVRYDQIICVLRDKKIIPIGSHVLVKPVYDEEVTDIELPEFKLAGYTAIGAKKGKIIKSGLVTELNEKPKYLEGIVEHIGTPFLCDEQLDIKKGDKILFLPESDWMNEIEGESYYVMKQRDIIAKIE